MPKMELWELAGPKGGRDMVGGGLEQRCVGDERRRHYNYDGHGEPVALLARQRAHWHLRGSRSSLKQRGKPEMSGGELAMVTEATVM